MSNEEVYEPFMYNKVIFGEDGEKKNKISKLYDKIEKCSRCSAFNKKNTKVEDTTCVFPRGNCNADIMIVGQSNARPQAQYSEKEKFWPNVPFLHGSGEILNKCLLSAKLNREDIWLTNVIKAHPPGNRECTPDEVDNCKQYLLKEIEIIEPKIIICLGLAASKWFLKTECEVFRDCVNKSFNRLYHKIIPFYHPAYIYRQRSKIKEEKYVENFKLIISKSLERK